MLCVEIILNAPFRKFITLGSNEWRSASKDVYGGKCIQINKTDNLVFFFFHLTGFSHVVNTYVRDVCFTVVCIRLNFFRGNS